MVEVWKIADQIGSAKGTMSRAFDIFYGLLSNQAETDKKKGRIKIEKLPKGQQRKIDAIIEDDKRTLAITDKSELVNITGMKSQKGDTIISTGKDFLEVEQTTLFSSPVLKSPIKKSSQNPKLTKKQEELIAKIKKFTNVDLRKKEITKATYKTFSVAGLTDREINELERTEKQYKFFTIKNNGGFGWAITNVGTK